RTGNGQLINQLADRLSGADCNSLLLEVFARRAGHFTGPELLKQYEQNRFVQPAETDLIHLLERSLATLVCLRGQGFVPLQMSPLSQLGACSVVATVSQDKVISALRNCEVLSDATNALALYICSLKKKLKGAHSSELLRYCTVQRHVRAQEIKVKGFSPHFTIGCLVSSGIDTGNFAFEKQSLSEHFNALNDVLTTVFNTGNVRFRLQRREGYAAHFISAVLDYLHNNHPHLEVAVDDKPGSNNYYRGLQFKADITVKQGHFEIADGGFVNWTQQLLNNKKERFFIAGFGLELLTKMEEGLM
ncbi:MAG TPA: hypothetical protein VM187_04245, partial [Niastella sp.]|nr:hypothetical protein [Niastella sp.]